MKKVINISVTHPDGDIQVPLRVEYKEYEDIEGGSEPHLQRKFWAHDILAMDLDCDPEKFVHELIETKAEVCTEDSFLMLALKLIAVNHASCSVYCIGVVESVSDDPSIDDAIQADYDNKD